MRQQQAPQSVPAPGRHHEQIFQVDARQSEKRRVVLEEQREAGWLVVRVPDEHLGGWVRTKERPAEFLLGRGLSKHFLPERVELVDTLPKTASGKIRKVELRSWLTDGAPGSGPAPDAAA